MLIKIIILQVFLVISLQGKANTNGIDYNIINQQNDSIVVINIRNTSKNTLEDIEILLQVKFNVYKCIAKLDTLLQNQESILILKLEPKTELLFLKYRSGEIINENAIKTYENLESKDGFSKYFNPFFGVLTLIIGAFLSHFFNSHRERSKLYNDRIKEYLAANEKTIKEFYNICSIELTSEMIFDKYAKFKENCLIPPKLDYKITKALFEYKDSTDKIQKMKIISNLKEYIYSFLTKPYHRFFKKFGS